MKNSNKKTQIKRRNIRTYAPTLIINEEGQKLYPEILIVTDWDYFKSLPQIENSY
jgi:hypothetical protein